MACLSPWRRKIYIDRRNKLTNQILALDTVIDNAISSGEHVKIRFDSGEGEQESTYRSLNELQKMKNNLELSLDRVLNALSGRGVVNMGLKR